MKRMQLNQQIITFYDGCEMYLENCRERNLRKATINHYQNSYKQMYKYFSPDMPIDEMTAEVYNGYVVFLKERLNNDVSITLLSPVIDSLLLRLFC